MSRSGLSPYTPSVYQEWRDLSASSAAAVMPVVLEMTGARRVIDVGCGIGTWLAAAVRGGATEILGVDGDYVDRTLLQIDADRFVSHDLSRELTLEDRFDLAISLEVAEHLPAERADSFVADLCRLAPLVLFSAAIPHQGGLGHVNEQWPAYWSKRFSSHGFVTLDGVRDLFWEDHRVAPWYAQNTLMFADLEAISESDRSGLERYLVDVPLARVHPSLYMKYADGRYQRTKRRLAELRSKH